MIEEKKGSFGVIDKGEAWQQRNEDGTIMRNILIGIIIFLFVYVILFLRKSKRETEPGK